MSTPFLPLLTADTDRLLAGIVLLHEASKSREALPELPQHLAQLLGLSAVTLTLVTLNPKGQELSRARWTTLDGTAEGGTAHQTYWITEHLQDRATTRRVSSAPVTQFLPDGQIRAIYDMDADHVLAIELFASVHSQFISTHGRTWLFSLLTHVVRNISLSTPHVNRRSRLTAPLNQLTRSEWRVLLALDSEAPEKGIADRISMSVHTIHSHIKNIFRKLRVQSRLSAIFMLRTAEREALFQELYAALGGATSRASGELNASLPPAEEPAAGTDNMEDDGDQIGDATGPQYRHAPAF